MLRPGPTAVGSVAMVLTAVSRAASCCAASYEPSTAAAGCGTRSLHHACATTRGSDGRLATRGVCSGVRRAVLSH